MCFNINSYPFNTLKKHSKLKTKKPKKNYIKNKKSLMQLFSNCTRYHAITSTHYILILKDFKEWCPKKIT